MAKKTEMKYVNKAGKEWYESSCGMTLQREFDSLTPNGSKMDGRWVLRDNMDILVDWGQYRNDIAEHNNLDISSDGKR